MHSSVLSKSFAINISDVHDRCNSRHNYAEDNSRIKQNCSTVQYCRHCAFSFRTEMQPNLNGFCSKGKV